MEEVFTTVSPVLVTFINSFLSLRTVPSAFKHAIIRPLLKKTQIKFKTYFLFIFSLQKFRKISFYATANIFRIKWHF